MRFSTCTNQGMVRGSNQDAFGHRQGLFLVADGMGGHRGGEVASRLAVETILAAARGVEPMVEMREGFAEANRVIREHAGANVECEGMGTTVAALYIFKSRAYLAHIGDSRIYRMHRGQLALLTRDHTLVEELVRQGTLSAEEARNHPQRSLLTRALGTAETPKVEYAEIELEQGDLFLLCSDGLTAVVSDEEIAAALTAEADPRRTAEELVALANQHGGPDNITVIVIDYHD